MPVEALGHNAANEWPSRDSQPGEAAVDADNQSAPLRRERRGEDGQAQRQDCSGAEALNGAGNDQLGRVWGKRASGRRQREQRQAKVEDPPSAKPIAERGGGDDPGRERDAVGVDRPLQGREVGVQVALHPRQCRGHDERVEYDHEVGGRGEAEHPTQLGRGAVARIELFVIGALQQVPPRRADLRQ